MLLIVVYIASIGNTSVASTNTADDSRTIDSVYEITTRGDLKEPLDVDGRGSGGYPLKKTEVDLIGPCPPEEIVIFVHGWYLNENEAKERLDRVKMSLEHNDYNNISLVGYSWGSDIDWEPAKQVAKENGQKLAQFIVKYVNACKTATLDGKQEIPTDIRLIGHSLGSRVILSTLDSLHNNSMWNDDNTINFNITSVHLLGAAVDNEEVSLESIDKFNQPRSLHDPAGVKQAYGPLIKDEVVNFYNMYNHEDNVFQFVYPNYEYLDDALGLTGKQQDNPITLDDEEIPVSSNYLDVDVQPKINATDDSDGNGEVDLGMNIPGIPTDPQVGDNHGGYIGFRSTDRNNPFAGDGAMDVVVGHWRNDTSSN